MTDPEHNLQTPPGAESDANPIEQSGDSTKSEGHQPNRAAAVGAAIGMAVAGVAAEAATANAAPVEAGVAHVQPVGSQAISDGKILETGRVSAEALLGIRPTKQNKETSAAEQDPGYNYTLKFFKDIQANQASSYDGNTYKADNPPLMAFNGVAVVSSDARWYKYIDSSLSRRSMLGGDYVYNIPKLYNGTLATYGLHGHRKNTQISTKRPVIKYDGHRWWIGVTNETAANYGNQGQLDKANVNQPSEQVTVMSEWRWTPLDKNVQLYQYATDVYTPKVQPFMQLYANYIEPGRVDGQPSLDNGTFDDFLPADPGWRTLITPSKIAGWQDLHMTSYKANKGYGDYPTTDGGRYVTPAQMKQELRHIGVKPYHLPSDPKQVKKIMGKYSVYIGND